MSILSTFLSHHIRFDFKRFVSKKTNYREGGGNCIIKINIHLKPKLKSYFLIQDRNSIEIHRMKLCQWCDVVYGDTETLSNVQMCVVCAFVQFVHCVIRLTLWKLWGGEEDERGTVCSIRTTPNNWQKTNRENKMSFEMYVSHSIDISIHIGSNCFNC